MIMGRSLDGGVTWTVFIPVLEVYFENWYITTFEGNILIDQSIYQNVSRIER